MSSHYHAGQYNDSFKPTRLKDWRFGAQSYPGRVAQFSCKQRCPTRFIACDNGHLYPNVPRNACTSPWGDYRTWVWEEKTPCSCVSRLRHPQRPQTKAHLPSSLKKRKPTIVEPPTDSLKKPQRKGDPILQYLKHQKLPVVWMVGLPTKKIGDVRRSFCKTFAESQQYAYVDLDELIATWKQRQGSKVKQMIDVPVELRIPSLPTAFPDWFPSPPDEQTFFELSPENEEFPVLRAKPKVEVKEIEAPEVNPEKFMVTVERERVKMPKDFGRITFDQTEKLGTAKILELLKFALIEALPAKGFIIENFPLDLSDVATFEQTFYPASLGIYFTETFFRNQTTGRAMGPIRKNVSFPSNYQRTKGFSYEKGDKVVQVHGNRMICLVNAENVTNKTLNQLENLLDKHLTQHSKSGCALQLGLDQVLSQDSIYPAGEFGIGFENAVSIGKGKEEVHDTRSSQQFGIIRIPGGGGGSGGSYSSNFEEYITTPPATGATIPVRSWFHGQTTKYPSILEQDENLTETEDAVMNEQVQDPDAPEPMERVKKRRTRFTKLHSEATAEMAEIRGGDEIPTTTGLAEADDSGNEEPLIMPEFEQSPMEEEKERAPESDKDKDEEGYKSDLDSIMSSEEYHYTDDWEPESSGNEDETMDMPSDQEESFANIDPRSSADEGQEGEVGSSGSDRSYSPESGVEKLMTASRISMQSSSNESMSQKDLKEFRGRSRVRRTKLRSSTSCKGSGESIYEHSSPAPRAIGFSQDCGEEKKRVETLTSMNAGDIEY